MKKSSILGLLFSIFFCLQSKPSQTQGQITTTGILPCNRTEVNLGPTPKSPGSKNFGVALLITVSTTAIICNVLIIHVVRVNPKMHTITNYLIVNMAFGDMFASIMTTILSLYTTYNGYAWTGDVIIGEYIYCRMVCPLYYLFMFCSIYSLVAITFDRFLAVTRPLKYKHRSPCTKFTIPGIWGVSILASAHYAVRDINFCSHEDVKFYCVPVESITQAFIMLSLGFVFPHAIIVILYMVIAYKLCKRRVPGEHTQKANGQTSSDKLAKKVTAMIVCILVSFDVAYVPILLVYMAPVLLKGEIKGTFLQVLAYKILLITNGISNALIYAVFNDNFQAAFKETLCFKPLMMSVGNLAKTLTTRKVYPSTRDMTSSSAIPATQDKSSSSAVSPE